MTFSWGKTPGNGQSGCEWSFCPRPMMDGGALPPHISVYACDRRANAVMRKRDEPGPNQN